MWRSFHGLLIKKKYSPQSANLTLGFIITWRTMADETLSICSASTQPSALASASPLPAPPLPWRGRADLRITSRRLMITLLDWERCSWCRNPSSNQYLWPLPLPPLPSGSLPFLSLHVKYPRATLSPHFNYSLKVISGWRQSWSWAELKMP